MVVSTVATIQNSKSPTHRNFTWTVRLMTGCCCCCCCCCCCDVSFSAWNMGQMWRTTTVVLAHMGVVDGCRCCSRDSARRYFRRCWPLLSPLLSPMSPTIRIQYIQANELPLGETRFLILYLLIWWCFLEKLPQ